MSDYNWCHNPDCHKIETQSRVRGTGDNKVLRTVKIKIGRYNYRNDDSPNIWDYFCNQNCLFKQPSETPIKVRTEKYESYRYDYGSHIDDRPQRVPYMATRKIIENSS